LSDLYTLEKFQNYKINQNFRFHKIVEIKYGGIKKVLIKQPFYHNYLKNNFILHNSIEQDADIVIMLYREDYYNDKTSTTDHLTEFIIAKHRTVRRNSKTYFDPTITAFKNLKN
jgi:replicative DNA helicase